ncbi:MAG: site-specific integrase [Methanosarcina sp.]
MANEKIRGNGSIHYRADRKMYCGQLTIGIKPITGGPDRRTMYGKKKKDVQKKMDELKSSIIMGTYQSRTSYTVGSWLDYWLETCVEPVLSYKSCILYSYIIRVHLKPAFGSTQLEKLTANMIENLLRNKLRPTDNSKGLKIRTVNYIRQTLRTSLKEAKAQGLININVAESARLPKNAKEPHKEKAFTLEEMQLFIDGSKDSPYHFIWEVAFLTGLRRGELLGLKWKDIDFDNCRIKLSRQVILEYCKPVLTEFLKTEGSSQEILVLPIVIERLKLCRLKQKEGLLKLGMTLEDDDLVFTTHTKLPYRPDVISHIFTQQRKKLGLRDGLSMHSTRHTFATLGIEYGIEATKMKDFMRHTDLSTTMGYVGKMKDSSYKMELEKLERVVGPIFDEVSPNK